MSIGIMFDLVQTAVVVPNFSSYTVQMVQLRLQSKGEDWRIVALLQRNEKVQSIGDICDKQTCSVLSTGLSFCHFHRF